MKLKGVCVINVKYGLKRLAFLSFMTVVLLTSRDKTTTSGDEVINPGNGGTGVVVTHENLLLAFTPNLNSN